MPAELEILFSSAARVEILCLFLQHPERQFYQREIERETGQPIRAVQREVKRLVEVGLLSRSAEGNRVFYRVDPDFPILEELTALFQKAGLIEPASGEVQATSPHPSKPQAPPQPFDWMDALPAHALPPKLRQLQIKGEWDQAY